MVGETVMAAPEVAKTDRDWEAENDASTLAQAAAIRNDKKRMHRATIAAMRMAKEQRDKADELARIAKEKKPKADKAS